MLFRFDGKLDHTIFCIRCQRIGFFLSVFIIYQIIDVTAIESYVSNQLEVSEELGITQSVISRLWQRFQDDGNVSRCYSTGRPQVTTPNEDRYLAVTAKRKRRSTASDLSRQLSSATGTTVSRQTVYRRLGHIGLYARMPLRCVPLTATHCRLRLTWSREHALWTPQQWSCVMFSDESRFSLQSDSHRTLIWRAPGTRYHQENTIERHRYGGASWLIWGGIFLGPRTDLHVQSVTMTGHIYRDVILEQPVNPLPPVYRNFGGHCLMSGKIDKIKKICWVAYWSMIPKWWTFDPEVAEIDEWYRYRIVAGFVTSSSPIPLKTRRVGQRCTLNLSRAETSSRWRGVVVRRGGASSGVVHIT
ncbi:transposable element Tcb1 transposase [Trichonephila clavipes]|nr:transposable element Tcb1 transposase [Trichonephila clavipes]